MSDEVTISSFMDEKRKFAPTESFKAKAYIKSLEEYSEIHDKSIQDPEGFWAKKAEQLDWIKKWDKVYSWDPKEVKVEWFIGAKLNVTYNCLDRHVKAGNGDKKAIIWEGEPPGESKTYTYKELLVEVNKFANVLKDHGIVKGDRAILYLPMIPELAIAMLACARVGAIHSIVFGGFSADSIKDRILDSDAKIVITSDGSNRNGKVIPLKQNVDKAVSEVSSVTTVLVVKRTGNEVEMKEGLDVWVQPLLDAASDVCEPEEMDANDPLFILYTSGTTGKPKGVVHAQGGYLLYAYQTFKWVFDYHEGDIWWCTADIGWITGHSYIVYGPLANGATSLMFEGVPFYPEPDRFWEIVEKYRVNQFYTAPTAIRAIAAKGDEYVEKHDLSSLNLLGTVGEPINPEAWMWYYNKVGGGKCPIVDTWWQTETGGILITPLAGAMDIKPGSASKPFVGVDPVIVKEDGSPTNVNEGGFLCIKKPWPGMMRTVWGDHQRFKETYFSRFPPYYFTGDGARVDEEGDYWLMGRVDDVINISGHRIGTAEVESALVSHETVAEAAVVPFPHEIKGQALYAFVTLNHGVEKTDELKKILINHVKEEIGPIAKPDKLQFADSLPKTRSGKIMRRILKAIAEGKDDVGNVTTLADPSVVEVLKADRQ
ncbi:MAG: acetate--CoA ligase [Candidatus Altiarchaeota archaeon]